jgi:hypothetical protein
MLTVKLFIIISDKNVGTEEGPRTPSELEFPFSECVEL